MKNILFVLELKENFYLLLSLPWTITDFYCFPWEFVIKDLRIGRTLLEGPTKGNLCVILVKDIERLDNEQQGVQHAFFGIDGSLGF